MLTVIIIIAVGIIAALAVAVWGAHKVIQDREAIDALRAAEWKAHQDAMPRSIRNLRF